MTHYMGIICFSFTRMTMNSSRIFQKFLHLFCECLGTFSRFPYAKDGFSIFFLSVAFFYYLTPPAVRADLQYLQSDRIEYKHLQCDSYVNYIPSRMHEQVVSDCKSWYLGHWDFLDSSGKSGKSRWTTLIVQRPLAPSNLRWGVPFGSRQVWLGDAIYRRLYHAAPPFL